MWIGVSDIIEEDRWVYSSTQEVVSHTEFGPGEPNAYTAQNCIALWRDFHGQWADHTCAAKEYFICEEIIQQVLKHKESGPQTRKCIAKTPSRDCLRIFFRN